MSTIEGYLFQFYAQGKDAEGCKRINDIILPYENKVTRDTSRQDIAIRNEIETNQRDCCNN